MSEGEPKESIRSQRLLDHLEQLQRVKEFIAAKMVRTKSEDPAIYDKFYQFEQTVLDHETEGLNILEGQNQLSDADFETFINKKFDLPE